MTAYRKYTVIGVLLLFLSASQSYLLRPFWFDESLTLLNFALQPLEKIYADGDRDFWMTSQEALEYGMIDEILTKKK